jgi:hypothetical protein
MRKGLRKKERDLNLPSNISLHHQPFFEGKRVEVEFQFETMEEYKVLLSSYLQRNL